jgi:hypothetical protein
VLRRDSPRGSLRTAFSVGSSGNDTVVVTHLPMLHRISQREPTSTTGCCRPVGQSLAATTTMRYETLLASRSTSCFAARRRSDATLVLRRRVVESDVVCVEVSRSTDVVHARTIASRNARALFDLVDERCSRAVYSATLITRVTKLGIRLEVKIEPTIDEMRVDLTIDPRTS